MTSLAVISIILVLALLVSYRLGRKSFQVKTLKQDVKTGEKANEIIKEQRDGHINSVDDADSMWNKRSED